MLNELGSASDALFPKSEQGNTSMLKKWRDLGEWSPLNALKCASETKWLIDGVIPSGSINWMVASPESFKTFIALDMAACIANGRQWHGRETDTALVLYVAGEGGNDIHIRRASADMAANDTGPLCIVQMRPRLDESCGLATLMALIYGITDGHVKFPEMAAYEHDSVRKYLTPEERTKYDALESGDMAAIAQAYGWRKEADLPDCIEEGSDFARAATRHRYSAWDEAIASVYEDMDVCPNHSIGQAWKNIFLVVDTYSQTSADDTKAVVSRYIKTLRDLQDKAGALGAVITVMVIDHTTKSGDTYMGSLAKEGDTDTMIEVERHGNSHAVTLKCSKMKMAVPFAPIHLDLKPVTLEGFADALGRPLTSLIVSDGEQAYKVRKAAGADKDTIAAIVFALLTESGSCVSDDLRQRYASHESNEGKLPNVVSRAYLRAIDKLTAIGVIELGSDGAVTMSSEGKNQSEKGESVNGHTPLS